MSLINQVLQDLEARRGGIEGRRLPDEVRALPPRSRRTVWPWFLAFVVAAVAIAAGLWLAWPEPPAPAMTSTTLPPHPVVLAEPETSPVMSPPSVLPGERDEAAPARAAPLRPALQRPVPRPAGTEAPPPAASAETSPSLVAKEVRDPTPRERANGEYLRATAALKQGREDAAESGLRRAMDEDPTWSAPRQALLGLLLAQRRLDAAQQMLAQSAARDPLRMDVVLPLARLQVEAGNAAAALETLRRAEAGAAGQADYFALKAAVLQRLNRHREAIAAYDTCLRLDPRNGVWWMGLGISLDADGRTADSREAYRRARDSGSLNADSMNFVRQKLSDAATPP